YLDFSASLLMVWCKLKSSCLSALMGTNTMLKMVLTHYLHSPPPFDGLDYFLSQEPTKEQDLRDLIHKLSKSENAILYQDFRDTAKQEKNRRGAESGLTTRKACRIFFWKTYATC
uniref:Somatostatin/Cortistatin C-terminal domain-containing protein n=1 Tax=Kryptolebias marmoratus TaxID=37003 RepID=A0A3Q3GZ09_KRYMA